MSKKVAINGFGRIGRTFLKIALKSSDIEVVAINDLIDLEQAAYLLKYDSAQGEFKGKIEVGDGFLKVDGKEVKWLSEKDPNNLPWGKLGIDVVVESTGVFTDFEKANAHIIGGGAKKVVISGPVKNDPPSNLKAGTVLIGVNTKKAQTCDITSNASCTTNAVGIPIDILDKELGVEKALLNTVHAYTASQPSVDVGSKDKGKLRLGRAAAQNIVPTSTGAAIATTKVLNGLSGNFDGIALRVPVISGSIADITFIAKRNTTVEEVNSILTKNVGGLFTVTNEEIVSSDIVGKPYVAIADLNLTRVVGGNLVKVLFWYDNEMGYTYSLIEHVRSI